MASLGDYRTPEGFYVFHNKDLPNGPTRLTDDAILALLNAGKPIPKGVSMTPTAYQAYQSFLQNQQQAPPEAPADPGGGYDFSYGGGGGGGGGAPVRPPYDPYRDPAFQGLLAALNLKESTFRSGAQGSIDEANRALELRLPNIALAGGQARLGVNNNYEARGLARSGSRLRDLATQRAGEQQQVAAAQQATAERIGLVNRTLNENIADLARQRAESELQARAANAY